MFRVRPKETHSVYTRDRVRLDADVYYPDAPGEFPVLLMRQPYGRAIASTVVYAHPTWYAAHGYIVVIQDVRGRGSSEGEFDLFAHEIEDGFDTVAWAADLPGSTGQVGMYGFSYQGMTQLYAAIAQPPALKTICPAMIGYDLYTDWAYEGGAFCLQANLGWAIQLATETARLKGDEVAYQALFAASRHLPVYDAIPARPDILQQFAPDSFYHAWLDHPEPGEYWERLSPKSALQAIDLPMLHIGGWFDTFLRGTLHLYREMAQRSQFPQHLVIGPWAHLPWGRSVGSKDYGSQAITPVDHLQIQWFDYFLKGHTLPSEQSAVSLFEMGRNQWRGFQAWPSSTPQSYFLASTGLANIDERAGTLVNDVDGLPQQQDVLVHDPWRPVPALGGHAVAASGSWERSGVDSRTDVVTYTSAPLVQALKIVGEIQVEVWCRADTPSFDLSAVVSEVYPDGKVYSVTQGYRRVDSEQTIQSVNLTLQATCIEIPSGNALRLSLSGACFPAYPVNLGTGAVPGESHAIAAQIITLTIYSGEDFPSRIVLPVGQF